MTALLAYVGPGPGLSMGWALLVLIATILGSILAVFLWPLRVMLRKIRGGEEEEPEQLAEEEAEEPEALPPSESEPAARA